MTTEPTERLISLREAARLLGVHHSTLSRAVNRGQLRATGSTPGGWPRFRWSDVKRLQDAGVGGYAGRNARAAVQTVPSGPASAGEEALSALPDLARKLVGADYAAVTILTPEGRVSRMFYSGITPEGAAKIGAPPEGKGVLGLLGPEDSPLRLDHISDHPKSAGFPEGHPPMDSLLGVRVTGVTVRANLYVANGPGRSGFTLRDEEMVKALAAYAHVALLNEELLARESRLRRDAQVAESRLDAVIRSMTAGVLIVDAAGAIVFANDECRRLLALPLEPGAGRTAYLGAARRFRFDGTIVPADELPISRVLREKRPDGPIELQIERPDGTRVPFIVSAAPVLDSEGNVVSAVSVFQDLTRLKELDEVKRDFLSMVTHDLRTPVTTIKGIAQAALAEAEPGSGGAGYLDAIDEEADYLTDLVSNFLDMSRIEAGVNIFDFETCHMADLVDDAVRRAKRSRQGAGRELTADVPAGLPSIYADPAQVGRVLDNLLSNALKYSAGPVAVRAFVGPDGQVVTEVSDMGEGIPAAYLDGIFNKFFRVRQSERRGREGAGLGLAICKAIIDGHRGGIGVRSRERQGSTFWFALPPAK